MNKQQKGFTLIELLVVVLIIGILSAVAVPQYQQAVDKAKYTQARTLLEMLLQAQNVYRLANGKYTMNFSELDIELPTPISVTDQSEAFIYTYSWGYCYAHYTGYGACYVNLGKSARAGYSAYWSLSTGRACWAFPTNNTRANKLCQKMTNSTTGYNNAGGGFRSYKFK